MKTYSQKLRDPRWQKKRLQVLERDRWACQRCYSKTEPLEVHHKEYGRGDPWDVPDEWLVTLCEDCHEAVALLKKKLSYLLCSSLASPGISVVIELLESNRKSDVAELLQTMGCNEEFLDAIIVLNAEIRHSFVRGYEIAMEIKSKEDA